MWIIFRIYISSFSFLLGWRRTLSTHVEFLKVEIPSSPPSWQLNNFSDCQVNRKYRMSFEFWGVKKYKRINLQACAVHSRRGIVGTEFSLIPLDNQSNKSFLSLVFSIYVALWIQFSFPSLFLFLILNKTEQCQWYLVVNLNHES